jgi:hypothetical protein
MRTLLLLPLAVLALAACGRGEETEPQQSGPPAPTPGAATGPGLTVEEAMASDLEGPLLVRGMLLADDESTRLCDALAESYPPQCGGRFLRVEGLDLATMTGLTSAEGVTWSEGLVKLLGDVEDETLVVSATATG